MRDPVSSPEEYIKRFSGKEPDAPSSDRFHTPGWVLAGLLLASLVGRPGAGRRGPPEVPPGLPALARAHADSGAPGGAEPGWNTVVADPAAGWVRV